MSGTQTSGRDALLASVPERFDETWTGYEANTLSAVRQMAHAINLRNDADSIYVARALDFVSARTISVLRNTPGIDALVPTSNEIPVGAESVVYRIYDAVGMAKIIGANVDDLPRVDVRSVERTARVQTIGVSYGYTFQEVRNAVFGGAGLPARKAAVARDVVDRKINSIKVRGDAAYNIYGLVNHPNIPAVVPTNGTWSDAARTADQIAQDFTDGMSAIYAQSKGNFRPTVVGMPYQLRIAALRRRVANTSTTAMQLIQETFPDVQIVEVQELAGAGAGGTHAMIFADRNQNYYAYESVLEFTEHPPQARGLELVVPCEAQTAGVIVRQPLALAKMEGL
jgi:hypothetical protein